MYIGATGLDADCPYDFQRGVPHYLVFFIGKGLGGGDRYAVAGVDAHRVEVFDGADNDNIVLFVSHYLKLILFPSDDRFFDKDLADWA